MEPVIHLIKPYGGNLVDLNVPAELRSELLGHAGRLPSLILSERGVNDLELLATGAFSPLASFMNEADLKSVVQNMRLADGTLFPIPVTLTTDRIEGLATGVDVALRDSKNDLLAILSVKEIFEFSHNEIAEAVFGTTDPKHPLVAEIQQWGRFNLAGNLRVLNLPSHHDSADLRLTPRQVREALEKLGNPLVVAFQTRNPIHRAHEELTKRAADSVGATLLIHPVVGLTKPDDVDYLTRVRSYRAVFEQHYDPQKTLLAVTPIAMRFAGPREALWHAIIRRNYGASHFIVGRDHASPGADSRGAPFYPPEAARGLVSRHQNEIGVQMVGFDEMVFVPSENRYEQTSLVFPGTETLTISGTEIRTEYLDRGRELPEWFTRPATARILSEAYPPRAKQGFCLWFTGFSGAGKSTTAEIVATLLRENGRRVTVLDGDVVRTHLSKGLGFSRDDRDTNIRRIGFVAAEIVRHGGAVICATVSPYRSTRDEVRRLVGANNFVEIFVDAPLDVCEKRDTKGMYAKARRGEIKDFTGIDDVYEIPSNPEITIDTVESDVAENARMIIRFLENEGFLKNQ